MKSAADIIARIKPATIGRGFESESIRKLCEDADEWIAAHERNPLIGLAEIGEAEQGIKHITYGYVPAGQ